MLVNTIALNIYGYVKIEIEGFFIQRFINLCISKGIGLENTKHLNRSKIIININKNDFKNVCKIAKQTNCKIKIVKKGGIPFVVHKYRKRKIFIILIIIIAILSFSVTRFIWNIDIICEEKINKDEIFSILKENGIEIGKPISKIETDSLINKIRLKRDDIAWVGIKIKGTNFIVDVVTAESKPEIIDETQNSNIVSNKKGIITRINVQSGTARVNIGDEVEEGTILVEGVMEGKYTGVRYVNSQADVYAKIIYSKSETRKLNEEKNVPTGREQNAYKINFNKFKINFNKGVSKFKNYDTIYSKKKLKLLSNYYLPIEIEKTTYKEIKKEKKSNTADEITNELKTKLENDIINSLENKYEKFIESNSNVEINGNNITVTVNCIVEERIGINKDLVF